MVQTTWLFLPMSKFYEGSSFGDMNLFCLSFFVWFRFGFLPIFGFGLCFLGVLSASGTPNNLFAMSIY